MAPSERLSGTDELLYVLKTSTVCPTQAARRAPNRFVKRRVNVSRLGVQSFRVQSFNEQNNSKPTKLAL